MYFDFFWGLIQPIYGFGLLAIVVGGDKQPRWRMVKRVQAAITGRVQGVFYRASTREKAKALGLKGFVRNLTDGSVSLEAEGEDESLSQLLSWCQEGPSGARVDEVKVNWITPLHTESEFGIIT